jgi:Xaa-Pro aminopeptidase
MNNRLARLRKIMQEKCLDAIIITGRPNTYYLSGFTGSTSFLLAGLSKAWLVVDFRYTIQAKEQVFEGIEAVELEDSFHKTLNDILKQNGIEKIGFEGNMLTYSEFERLKEKLDFAKSFISLEAEVDHLRMFKDADEIDRIQNAVLLGDKVFDHIIKFIKPGMKEIEVSAELEYTMKKLGAKGPSFETIVAAGPRSAMCHGTASENIIKKGDAIVLDFGVIYRNYCSDMTRTIFVGQPSDEMKKIYGIVLKAQQAVLDSLVSGMKAFDADKTARDIISEAGFGKNFGHGLGHGVGVVIHEDPRVSLKTEDIIQDGMVFTVEPGIYVEGFGGVRIEDMVVMVNGKPRNFTTSPKDIIVL